MGRMGQGWEEKSYLLLLSEGLQSSEGLGEGAWELAVRDGEIMEDSILVIVILRHLVCAGLYVLRFLHFTASAYPP